MRRVGLLALLVALAGCQGAALPDRFTERIEWVRQYEQEKRSADFDMVLVPGDAQRGIEPFYMSATEVTGGMFYDWSYCRDLDVWTAAVLQAQGLRPSPP